MKLSISNQVENIISLDCKDFISEGFKSKVCGEKPGSTKVVTETCSAQIYFVIEEILGIVDVTETLALVFSEFLLESSTFVQDANNNKTEAKINIFFILNC
jgi:hypothetical protein